MEIFGIGPAEMLLILVIALIVFGPGKLPEIGAALGRAVGDFRRASRDLTANLQDDIADVQKEIEGATKDVTGALGSVQSDVQGTIDSTQREVTTISGEVKALPAAQSSAPAPATTTATKKVEADEDPDAKWLRLGTAEGDGATTG